MWYDALRTHIVIEAQNSMPTAGNLWIPDVVHRFCVRQILDKPHQPKKLIKYDKELRSKYVEIEPWHYGEKSDSSV